MADDRIEIEIVLEDGSIQRGFANVKQEAEKTARSLRTTFSRADRAIGTSFINVFRGLSGEIAALGATFAAVFGSRAVLQAASVQEDAVNALNTSLKSAGEFSEEASRSLQDFASSLQAVTTVGDEVILGQIALARNFARTNEEAQRLVEAAVDLSAATGISLDSAVINLGKTFSGLTGELGESVPALRELTAEQLKAGQAIQLVADRFGGSAAAQVQTFSGALAQLGNLFGDLLEEIGFIITRSPVVIQVFRTLSTEIGGAVTALGGFRNQGDVFGNFIKGSLQFAEAINATLITPLEVLFNVSNLVFQGLRVSIQGFVATIAQVSSALVGFFSPDSELAQNLALFRDSSGQVFKDFQQSTNEAFNGVFNTDTTTAFQGFIERLNLQIQQVKDGPLKNLENGFKNTGSKITKTAKDIEINVGQLLGAGIASTVQTVVGALAAGENAFSAFGNALLSVFGDIAINIGSTLIPAGLGIEALKALQGAAAVAAGIALVSIGTLLKAASPGGPSLTSPAGTAIGDAGVVQGGGLFDESEEIEERETAVQVVVNGSVFDSQETGLRIVDILNNSFDTQGTRLAQV